MKGTQFLATLFQTIELGENHDFFIFYFFALVSGTGWFLKHRSRNDRNLKLFKLLTSLPI